MSVLCPRGRHRSIIGLYEEPQIGTSPYKNPKYCWHDAFSPSSGSDILFVVSMHSAVGELKEQETQKQLFRLQLTATKSN
jgi:hypothetical protein